MPTIQEAAKNTMEQQAAIVAGVLLSIPPQSNYVPLCPNQYAQITSGYMVSVLPRLDQSATIAILENRESQVRAHEIENEFNRLAAEWKRDRKATSSTTVLSMHPSYQLIIGMGEQVLPFIFADLQQGLDHWFWALRAITRENPVLPESRGNMEKMANAWLNWGREKGYVPH